MTDPSSAPPDPPAGPPVILERTTTVVEGVFERSEVEKVACPYCEAGPGEPCDTEDGGESQHTERVAAAAEVAITISEEAPDP